MKTPLHSFVSGKTPAAFALLLIAAVPTTAAFAKAGSTIVAHKAFYQMEMGDRQQTSQIVNINGRSAFAIERIAPAGARSRTI